MVEAGEGKQSLEFGGIRFTDGGVVEFDDDGIYAAVKREEVARIVLRSGAYSEHPSGRIAIGVGLMLVAFIGLLNPTAIGPNDLVCGAIGIALISAVGVGIIIAAMRPCLYFDVDCLRGRIRFVFHGSPSLCEIKSFVKSVELRFGYEIELEFATEGFSIAIIESNQGGDVSGRAILR